MLCHVSVQRGQPDAPAAEATDEDYRHLVDLLVDQIEFANVILLNKIDVAPKEDVVFLRSLVHRLNPDAKVRQRLGCCVA